ncbi:MAG: ABC transporter ATP-binding protein [Candidatus Amulumruptor caecigallinarius]|nr:ABC transporter ATP-binding protein [Candidatus Amulumruptor caecigallinarius]
MIELRNINKYYGNLHVLKNINLTVGNDEIVTVVGPSGAGKTTLLQIAGTLDKQDSGDIIYNGENPGKLNDRKLSEFRNRNIGFVFQFHQLLPEFTATENVAMPALIAGESRKVALDKAKHLLEKLGLAERLGHKPSQMSGGERQRTAIARALMNDPQVIFADEPTGSLDSHNRDIIRELIRRIREELHRTFVIVTHDPSMNSISDRVVEMRDGMIISDCMKSDLLV